MMIYLMTAFFLDANNASAYWWFAFVCVTLADHFIWVSDKYD